MENENKSKSDGLHKQAYQAIRDLGFDPSHSLQKIVEIEAGLRDGSISARIANSLLSDRITHLSAGRNLAAAVSDSQVRDEVHKYFERAIEDVFVLAEEFGVGLGEHARQIHSSKPGQPRQL